MQNISSILSVILIIFVFGCSAHSQDSVIVWYGNVDGSPIEAEIGGFFDINVYIQTANSIGGAHVCLGAVDTCIDSLASIVYGEIYYPFNGDYGYFSEPEANPPGILSQSMTGLSRDSYYNYDEPTLICKFVFRVAYQPEIVGDTISCLVPGLNTYQGPTAFSDTCGYVSYDVSENFSPVYFMGEVGIDEQGVPENFQLFQNYPNPFNGSTKISYQLSENSRVKLEIFDISGRKVAEPIDRYQQSGYHEIKWRPDVSTSGIYFCRLTTYRGTQIRKMIYLK